MVPEGRVADDQRIRMPPPAIQCASDSNVAHGAENNNLCHKVSLEQQEGECDAIGGIMDVDDIADGHVHGRAWLPDGAYTRHGMRMPNGNYGSRGMCNRSNT
jgi:hypothetical protein